MLRLTLEWFFHIHTKCKTNILIFYKFCYSVWNNIDHFSFQLWGDYRPLNRGGLIPWRGARKDNTWVAETRREKEKLGERERLSRERRDLVAESLVENYNHARIARAESIKEPAGCLRGACGEPSWGTLYPVLLFRVPGGAGQGWKPILRLHPSLPSPNIDR